MKKNDNLTRIRNVLAEKGGRPTLMDALGIEITEISAERIKGTMPVDSRTVQYYGFLHGGASVAFAETLASIAAGIHVDLETEKPVGLEINANHIRSLHEGIVYGEAWPLHLGKKTQVWHIELKDNAQKLICVSRCTMAVVSKSKP